MLKSANAPNALTKVNEFAELLTTTRYGTSVFAAQLGRMKCAFAQDQLEACILSLICLVRIRSVFSNIRLAAVWSGLLSDSAALALLTEGRDDVRKVGRACSTTSERFEHTIQRTQCICTHTHCLFARA